MTEEMKLAKERERAWRVLERATEAVGKAVQRKREAKAAYDLALSRVVTYKAPRGASVPPASSLPKEDI